MSNTEETLSWVNMLEQATELGIGSNGKYFTVEDGENIIRVISKPVHFGHYFTEEEKRPIFAGNASDEVKAKYNIKHMFACHVFNYKTKKLQIAEFGWSIAKAIAEFASSSQNSYVGCPPYDIVINKSGSGKQGTKYVVTPGRNEELMSEAIVTELEEAQSITDYLDEKKAKQAEELGANATESEKKAQPSE